MNIVKKILKWLGIGIGALLVLIILASLVMNVIFSRELRQTMEQQKAEGRALTIADIRPAPVPDDQNAAPLFQKAGEMLGRYIHDQPIPLVAPAIKELSDLIVSNSLVFGMDISTWPAAHREALPRLIQAPEMQALFAVLHEAAGKPGYNNNLKYEDGPGMLFPNLGSIRQTARFLSIKAELAAQAGNGAEAFATILEGLKLANLLQQEPVLVTQLVRIACDGIMINCLERIADKTDIPADQAQALIAELAQHTNATSWIRTFDAERMSGLWCFQTLRYGSARDISSLFFLEMNVPRWLGWGLKYPYAPILKKDFAVYLKLMAQLQDYYKVPYWKAAEILRNHSTDQQIPRYCLLTRMIFPNLDRVAMTNAKHDAAIAVARVGLALKLLKQRNGAYPDTLDKLAPEFLDTIPVDPFSGHALVYRQDGDGFILYSLGPNQQDDNGTPWPTKWDDKVPYDIVWKCER